MRRALGIVVAALATGCACFCDTDQTLRDRAGGGAIDCGLVPFGTDTTPALDCADAAIARGSATLVGWHRLARDTDERTYLVAHDGTASLFDYHGGLSGCPTLEERPCTGAITRTTDTRGQVTFTCPVATSRTVCSN